MGNAEERLLARARSRYGRIRPCSGKTLSQCFYYQNGCLQLWFNDLDGNTHLVYAPGEKPA